jgi:hypothetical protein
MLNVPTARARATNQPLHFLGRIDGRSRLARRRKDLVAILIDALGAPPTHLQQIQIRRAAELTAAAEVLRAKVLSGEASRHLLEALTALEGEARRATRELGIDGKPQAKRGLTLADLLREDAAQRAGDADDVENGK